MFTDRHKVLTNLKKSAAPFFRNKEHQASFIKATSIVTKQAWNEITVTTCEIDGFICKTCKDDLQPNFYFQKWGPVFERPGHF